jgi:hypothetical protein
MRHVKIIALLAVLVSSSVSCGKVFKESKAPVYLYITQLQGARGGGSAANQFTYTLQSDVLTVITSPPPCTTTSPCPTIFSDNGFAVLLMARKDFGQGETPTDPSLSNQVTINRYRVVYRRADGRNTPGVDVPYPFDGAVTATIQPKNAVTITFELVRHISKMEPPLTELVNNPNIISTIAEITFYGRDQVGNELNVTGYMTVDFGNFGD